MSAYFYPATAECAVDWFPVPIPDVITLTGSNNTLGGYGGGLDSATPAPLDISDYNGTTGRANIFVSPDVAATSAGIRDQIPSFFCNPGGPWYWVRQTDFKDWSGIGGVFWRKSDFIMEIDIKIDSVPLLGGVRDEAANLSAPALGYTGSTGSPYGASAAQGSGIMLKAIVTDPITLLEVVKDVHLMGGTNGWQESLAATNFVRQTVQLNLTDVTPEELATIVLRVTSQQYTSNYATAFPHPITPHTALDSTIYRVALIGDPTTLKSSGKQSAAMTSR